MMTLQIGKVLKWHRKLVELCSVGTNQQPSTRKEVGISRVTSPPPALVVAPPINIDLQPLVDIVNELREDRRGSKRKTDCFVE